MHLMLTLGDLCQSLAVVRDDGSDELYWDCKPNFSDGYENVELHGELVVNRCRSFLRPSNMVISCFPQEQYQWRLFYFNQQTGSMLDPSVYLKLIMDNPRDISIPVLTHSALRTLVHSKTPCELPLMEFDFLTMSQQATTFSRALQFALRHRLRRLLKHHERRTT
ncbi:hypothetical protein GCM10025791_08360 [Halioxenophilus aromaticivorans]|uniref:Uncharacterized protein n=1 Tax=Halioxenophilus aromaticivorans TaxID=1306992 RepID=A0AAV3TZ01_9ALTE